MSENKYYKHISQKPTDGDPQSRSYKRRKWKESWQELIGKEGWNLDRATRRLYWKSTWSKFSG